MPEANDTQEQNSTENTSTDNGQGQGQAPDNSSDGGSQSTASESWIDSLPPEAQQEIRRVRGEAARYRTERNQYKTKVDEAEDAKKSETQKAIERAERAEAKAAELEARTLRAEIAAAKGLSPKLAARLQGSSREELEKDADELLAEFGGGSDNGDRGDDHARRQGGRRNWGQGTRNGGGSSSPTEQMNRSIRGRLGAA